MSRAKTFAAVLTFFACVLGPALLWGGGGGFVTAFVDVTTAVSTGGITLSGPELMAVDSLGNVYIADTSNNQIVEVTATGVASVVSFPGLSPALASPSAVAVDGSGNLYVADSANSRVVKLSAGVASVVNTASLLSDPVGVAVDAAGDLYISDATNNDIVKVPAGGSAAVLSISGLGTPLAQPFGLALDLAGNLYIVDTGNIRIVKVTPGGVGSTYFTTGLVQPKGVAVDALGNLYIADTNETLIITASPTGNFGVVRMPGFALSGPEGVAVGVWGAVFIADTGNNRILEAQPAAVGFGHLQYGAVSGTSLTLNVTIGNGVTFGSVQAFTQGTPVLDFTVTATTCVAGTTTNAACTVNIQFLPTAAGLRKGTMVLYNNATPAAPILSVPLYGMADAPLATLSPGVARVISTGEVSTETPFQITEDGAGNLYVADYEGNNVLKIPPGGGSAIVMSLGELTTNEIAGVALDGAGNLFICDHFDNRILEILAGGTASVLSITGLSTGLDIPTGLAVDAANNLYISDYGNSRVVKVTPAGAGSVVATPGFTPGEDSVLGVAVDAAGTVYFPEAENNRVIKVTAAGAASLVVTEGLTPALSSPQGVAVDGFGNLYIADAGNDRLVGVTSAGVASVIPTPGLTDPSTLGSFYAIAADASGNVLVPDFGFNRLVEVNLSAAALAFPNTVVGATSSPQTATVTNIGDLPLVFATNPAYTANFSENSGDTNLCALGTSLAAGEVCDVSVEFTPQSVGSLSASITVTNNNLNGSNAAENVAVSGTGPLTTTSTALAAGPNPAIAGQSVLLTASVSPEPTGLSTGHGQLLQRRDASGQRQCELVRRGHLGYHESARRGRQSDGCLFRQRRFWHLNLERIRRNGQRPDQHHDNASRRSESGSDGADGYAHRDRKPRSHGIDAWDGPLLQRRDASRQRQCELVRRGHLGYHESARRGRQSDGGLFRQRRFWHLNLERIRRNGQPPDQHHDNASRRSESGCNGADGYAHRDRKPRSHGIDAWDGQLLQRRNTAWRDHGQLVRSRGFHLQQPPGRGVEHYRGILRQRGIQRLDIECTH